MRLLSNPIMIRMAVVLFVMGFAFWIATMLLRRMRRVLTEDSFAVEAAPELERLPMHAYNAVIQQLKQQKHELLSLQLVERRRAKTSENISAAVLSNLSSGVLFLDANGLVRTANAAAKSILGFASPVGLERLEKYLEKRDSVLHGHAKCWLRPCDQVCGQQTLRKPRKPTTQLLPASSAFLSSRFHQCSRRRARHWDRRACSLTKPNSPRSKGSRNCAEKCQARWLWLCAIRWLRFRATRSNWRSAAI